MSDDSPPLQGACGILIPSVSGERAIRDRALHAKGHLAALAMVISLRAARRDFFGIFSVSRPPLPRGGEPPFRAL
jgi:hypothetical protein